MVETTGDKKKYKLINKQVDKTVDSPCIQVCTYDEEKFPLIHEPDSLKTFCRTI